MSDPIPPRYRVAVAGYYGFGNLGDELLAEAATEALLRCGVGRERIVLLSNAPDDSSRRFGVAAVNRWKPDRVAEVLRRSDTLLLGGGGLFQDATSLRSCLYYWGLVRMSNFLGAVPWALGQSVGPLSTRAGRWLTRDALRRCRVVQVRDDASRAVCDYLGISVETGRDPVFSLAALHGTFSSFKESPKKFLINLRPCAGNLPERFARAIGEGLSLSGGEPLGIALSGEDERLMERLIDRKDLPPMPVARIESVDDAARSWRGAVGAAGMRLHFAVLSIFAGTPLVVAPYDPKVRAFANSHGIPLWREGPFPRPEIGKIDVAPGLVQEEIDTLCRRVL
ncbi:MAG: polysaccharide pyruvyl transferase CsaB [Synergistaceae bacterium]|jgi:polysaccharide pyruvyl transferase CsaB|nr:polysaccharide pyruvyl transferase CsaB [Synergistaceae bacterium]